jgi:hypothetical protein
MMFFKKGVILKGILTIILGLWLLFLTSPSFSQVEVLLLPLRTSGLSLSLSQELWELISTRLISEGITVVERSVMERFLGKLDPEALNEDQARLLGKKVGVRWVILGKAIRIGGVISLDLKILDVTLTSSPRAVYAQFPDEGALVLGLKGIASQIKERLLGQKEISLRSKGTLRAQLLYQSLGYSKLLRFSGKFIKGVAIGDVDGDGQNELVLMEPHKLSVYRDTGEGLKMVAEFEKPSTYNFLNVNLSDLDGDGKAEIAVSASTEEGDLRSFVLKLKGNELKEIKGNLNRYFRSMRLGGRKVLLSQAIGPDRDYVGGIEEVRLEKGKLIFKPLKDLKGAEWVLSFVLGRFSGAEKPEIARLNELGELEVLSPEGERLWKGSKKYGASDNYFDRPKVFTDAKGMPTGMPRRVYLPLRMEVVDLDKDGYEELLLAENQFTLGETFERVRLYNAGRIISLVWDGMAMAEAWRTQDIPGCIFDFEVGDVDNDGLVELVVAVANAPFFKSGSSNLVVFELYE